MFKHKLIRRGPATAWWIWWHSYGKTSQVWTMQKNPNEYRHSVGPSLSLTRAHVAHAARLKSKWSRSQRMKEFDCTSRRISQYTQKELESRETLRSWKMGFNLKFSSGFPFHPKYQTHLERRVAFKMSSFRTNIFASSCQRNCSTSELEPAGGFTVKQIMHTEIPAFFRSFRKPRNAHKQEQTGIALALFVLIQTALLKACSLRKEAFFGKAPFTYYVCIYICVCDFINIYISLCFPAWAKLSLWSGALCSLGRGTQKDHWSFETAPSHLMIGIQCWHSPRDSDQAIQPGWAGRAPKAEANHFSHMW